MSAGRRVNLAAQVTAVLEGLGPQDDLSLIAVNVTVLGAMSQADVRRHGDLKDTAVVMVNPPTLVLGMFVLARCRVMFGVGRSRM